MKKTFVIVLVLFPLLVGCKDKATQELLSKGTLRAATGKVVAVGPRYITMKDQNGKVVALSNVVNMERWGALPEACLRDQKNVTVVYRTVENDLNNTTTRVESIDEKK